MKLVEMTLAKYDFHAAGVEEWRRVAFYDPGSDDVYFPAHAVGGEFDILSFAIEGGVIHIDAHGHCYLPSRWLLECCREMGNDVRADAMTIAVKKIRLDWARRG